MTARPDPPFRPALSLLACIVLALLLCLPATGPAASVQESPLGESPFADYQFIAETDKVKEGENIGYTLILHAGASVTPQPIKVEFPLPDSALVVTASPELVLNDAERKLAWQGIIAPGQYLNFMILLVPTPGSAASNILQVSADISWPGGTHRFQSETEILPDDSDGQEAQPDAEEVSFAGSELIASADKVHEGETIVYTLAVRASGNKIPQRISVVFRPPHPVMLVSSSPPMTYSEEYPRELTWGGEISPGQEIVFIITLLTMPASASSGILPANAGISWRPKGREWETASHWLSTETEIHAKSTPTLYVLPNGIGLGKVELIVLGYLLGGSLFTFLIPMLILRREKRRRAAEPESVKQESMIEKYLLFVMSFVFVCTLGIAHFLISVAVEDIRRFVAYEEVSCTLLDKRIVLEEGTSSTRGGGPRTLSTTSKFNKPLVAVRYPAGGREVIAAGPPRPTAMLSPLDTYARRELARYERGKAYPCWYDPKRPETFVLARGISWGWYLSGAGALLLMYILGRSLLRRLKRN